MDAATNFIWKRFVNTYGILWLCLAPILPGLPRFVEEIENHIRDGTISEFHNKQIILLSNTGTTAAIMSQVTVTSIQLNGIESTLWSTRGFLYFSLLSSLFSVFLSFLKHQDMVSAGSSCVQSQLRAAHTPFRLFPKKQLDMHVVFAFYLPSASLCGAIVTYVFGMALYLACRITDGNWTTDWDNMNIFLVFYTAISVGVISCVWIWLTNPKIPKKSPSTQGLYIRDIFQTGSDRMQQTDTPHLHTSCHARDQTVVEMVTPPSHELFKALAEAAAAHKAAAAASEAVAAHYERISSSHLPIQLQERNSSSTGRLVGASMRSTSAEGYSTTFSA